ncbi:beta-ketoacyl synthase N-terminal-like domain-containing protein [Streptomyces sp. NPDC042319]|uniref:beta-ketoacyl synthase N-terminal-like domain-containing protein n=1 Tax=Streptomyces sp. NPDC042319 TaxID=3154332 RepID=UPI0033F2CD6C
MDVRKETTDFAADRTAGAVAVDGVGCRLPGGIASFGDLWEALGQGRDLVGEVPADRFDATRFVARQRGREGKAYTGAGGFLTDAAAFDAEELSGTGLPARVREPSGTGPLPPPRSGTPDKGTGGADAPRNHRTGA